MYVQGCWVAWPELGARAVVTRGVTPSRGSTWGPDGASALGVFYR